MKTYECIARSGNTGKQIVIFIRATSPGNAQMEALTQARQQFGNDAGAVTIVSVKEIRQNDRKSDGVIKVAVEC